VTISLVEFSIKKISTLRRLLPKVRDAQELSNMYQQFTSSKCNATFETPMQRQTEQNNLPNNTVRNNERDN